MLGRLRAKGSAARHKDKVSREAKSEKKIEKKGSRQTKREKRMTVVKRLQRSRRPAKARAEER